MAWTIFADEQDLIWARVNDTHVGFNQTLDDSVSALSPAGQPPGLSTYWLDKSLKGIGSGKSGRFLWGNSTCLVREDGEIVAQSLYALFEDERVAVEEFISGICLWRAHVVAAIEKKRVISLPPGVTCWAQRNPHRSE